MSNISEIPRQKDMSHSILSTSTKMALGHAIVSGKSTAADLAVRFNINRKTVTTYARKIRNGEAFYKQGGRNFLLDEDAENAVVQEVRSSHGKQRALLLENLPLLIARERAKTSARKGRAALCIVPSQSYLDKFSSRNNLSGVTGQAKTPARVTAEEDFRNVYSEAIMINAFQDGLVPDMILNIDPSSFFCPAGNDCVRRVVVHNLDKDTAATVCGKDSGEMGLFIKSVVGAFASGMMLSMVLVVACKHLSADDLIVVPLCGLSHRPDTSTGYVVFAQTRALGEKFWSWFLEIVMVPFLREIRKSFELSSDYPCFTVTDGEQSMKESFLSQESLLLLGTNAISWGKYAASCSAISQPLDRGNYFKASKVHKKFKTKDEVESRSSNLRIRLDNAFEEKFKNIPAYAKSDRDQVADAICRVVVAHQSACTVKIITDSFKLTGQYPFDLHLKIHNSKADISRQTLEELEQALPALTAIFKEHGKVTGTHCLLRTLFIFRSDSDMDAAGIRKTKGDFRSKEKDERVLHQQRACLINSPGTISQWQAQKSSHAARNRREKSEFNKILKGEQEIAIRKVKAEALAKKKALQVEVKEATKAAKQAEKTEIARKRKEERDAQPKQPRAKKSKVAPIIVPVQLSPIPVVIN